MLSLCTSNRSLSICEKLYEDRKSWLWLVIITVYRYFSKDMFCFLYRTPKYQKIVLLYHLTLMKDKSNRKILKVKTDKFCKIHAFSGQCTHIKKYICKHFCNTCCKESITVHVHFVLTNLYLYVIQILTKHKHGCHWAVFLASHFFSYKNVQHIISNK